MTMSLARLGRLLDLDRPFPGERTTWTVRTPHGVHTVELEQSVTGIRVRADGVVVGRSSAWSFSDEPFRFQVGGSAAILSIGTDTTRGTERASLLVSGEPVAQDAPAWRTRRAAAIRWGPVLALIGYLLGAGLILSAGIGDPLLGFTTTALATAVDMAWLAAVRGVDPIGLLPTWAHALAATRAGILLAGIELVLLVTLARDRRLQQRLPLLGSASRSVRVIVWSVLALAAAVLPALLDS